MQEATYANGFFYERLIEELWKVWGVSLSLISYKDDAVAQNVGIDGVIVFPQELEGKTIQIKMFRNTFKYGTFPWEVSRFLANENKHIPEPHAADFHVVVDPSGECWQLLIFETPKELVTQYYRIWEQIEASGNVPKASSILEDSMKNDWLESGKTEKCFKWKKDTNVYQLAESYTAFQRNIRCHWAKDLPHFLCIGLEKELSAQLVQTNVALLQKCIENASLDSCPELLRYLLLSK